MKAGRITVFILVLGTSLSGCGQKGPLYPETASPAEAPAGAGPDASLDRPIEK